MEALEILQPFGAENQPPLFMLRDMKIKEIRPLSEDKHIKLILVDEQQQAVPVLYFGMSSVQFGFSVGETVDVLISAGVNEYNGKRSVSAKLKDIRPAGFEQERYFSAKSTYEKIWRSEAADPRLKKRILPSREEIGKVYQLLRKNNGFSGDIELLYLKIRKSGLNYCKYRFVLDILEELDLIQIAPLGSAITLPEQIQKVDLNSSAVLHKLAAI